VNISKTYEEFTCFVIYKLL